MRLSAAPSGPAFVGAPGDSLVCLGGDQWTPGPGGGAGAPLVVLEAPAPFPLNPGGQVPLALVEAVGSVGALVLDGFELVPGGVGPFFYEVIWSAANDTIGASTELALIQDPIGLPVTLSAIGTSIEALSLCAVVRVTGEAPAAERTIQFAAGGALGSNLVQCRILIRRLTP